MTQANPLPTAPLILVVDDDEAIRLLLRIRLEREGYRVEEATDGEQALESYERLHPDMVLLDYMMPHMDGIATCINLRKLPGGESIPVLMVTALDDSRSVDQAFEAGATDYVTKPITWPVLRQRVRRLLHVKQTDESLKLRDRAIAAASNGIFITDAMHTDHPIIYINPAFERLTGYASGEILGQSYEQLFAGFDADPDARHSVQEALEEGREANVVLLCYRKDGSSFWNELTVAPVRDATERVSNFIWVQQDITERIQREEERQLQLRYEMALVTVIKELNRSTELDAVLNTALVQALRALDLEYGAIYLQEGEEGELGLRAYQGQVPDRTPSAHHAGGESIASEVARSGQPIVVTNIPEERPGSIELAESGTLRAQASLPLRAAGRVVGVMNVNTSHIHEFSPRDIGLVSAIADQVGTAIERAQLYETLREQSIRDPLTRLFNRRYMEETLEREIHQASRRRLPLSILMIDLDHFKKFNDTYGHDGGDALLRALGEFLQTNTRASDIACRFGGEEFLLIMPDTTLESARLRAEQLSKSIKTLHVYHEEQPLGQVTLSIGVAVFPMHGEDGAAVRRAADNALYQAKAQGRDRVVVSDATSSLTLDTLPESEGSHDE
ncbi:MAG: diguanylate cyclase [Ardenticatenales bacterium]|nr:diguanylate cyclase [Ardenticatenales bacterium]